MECIKASALCLEAALRGLFPQQRQNTGKTLKVLAHVYYSTYYISPISKDAGERLRCLTKRENSVLFEAGNKSFLTERVVEQILTTPHQSLLSPKVKKNSGDNFFLHLKICVVCAC